MTILSWKEERTGVLLETDCGRLWIVPYAPNIIRVRYTLAGEFSSHASLSVTADPGPETAFRVEDNTKTLDILTEVLRLKISKSTGAFTFYDGDGSLLMREPASGGKLLEPIEVYKRKPDDGSAKTTTEQTVDGVRTTVSDAPLVFDRKAYHTKLSFDWLPTEALYGLGSHEEGRLNWRGTHQYLYQQNTKVAVPVLVSTAGYAVLVDTYSLATFHDDQYGSYIWTDVDDELDYYFIYGPEFDQLVDGLQFLSGRPTMLPKWAFGYWQSKERYGSQQEVLNIAQEYRKRNIPLDVVVQDWMSWPEGLWGQKSLDPVRYPDPHALTRELHQLGVRLVVSIWPNLDGEGPNQKELLATGHMLANRSTYDAFSPSARKMYWRQANEGLFAYGVDGWWTDSTEPFGADWTGAFKPEPEERLRMNVEEFKKFLDPEYINAYSLLHSQGIYEGQRSVTQDQRVTNLTRSAYLGQQRYGTITWSGDIAANWTTMHNQIAAGLNFCVTGMPFWTLDVGGFFVGNTPKPWFWCGDFNDGCADLGYRELYTRWMQWATFLPIMRSHGTDTPREVWRFGNPGEPFYEVLVQFIRLRYRLLPYIYSVAAWASQRSYTMMRLLAFDFRRDPRVANVDDQYLFGPAFLVNPVVHPMYYESGSVPLADVPKRRSVYLPEGANWVDFWTGRRWTGGQTVEADAPLDILPLFIREGSIVPLAPLHPNTDLRADAVLDIRVYWGASSTFVLYEDAGDGYGYERGEYSTITIAWDEPTATIVFGERQGQYPGMAATRVFRVVMVSEVNGVGVGFPEEPAVTVTYRGEALHIPMPKVDSVVEKGF